MSYGPSVSEPTRLIEQVLHWSSTTPDAIAIIGARGRTVSYAELGRQVRSIAGGLVEAGMKPVDGVLFSVRPSIEALVLALGAVAGGGVLVFADPGAGPEVFAARVRRANPKWAIAESLLYAASGSRPGRVIARRRGLLLPDLAAVKVQHVFAGRRLPGVPKNALPIDSLRAATPIERPVERWPTAPAVIIFTAGTTQQPRTVVHTLDTLTAGLDLLRRRLDLGAGDIVHTDQLMLGLPALAGGATWSLTSTPLRPRAFVTQLRKRRVTHAFVIPADMARILDVTETLPEHVRCLLLGAAPVLPPLLKRVVSAAPAAEVLSVYGMTEAAPIAVVTAAEKLAHFAAGQAGDLLGRPLPGLTARIEPDGELVIGGPHIAGYLGHPTPAEIGTGDLATIDGSGRMVLLGRKQNMIIGVWGE
ncbi:MAG: class I adenylate-forming enzyme family protein [Mycobacteriales bacterium]